MGLHLSNLPGKSQSQQYHGYTSSQRLTFSSEESNQLWIGCCLCNLLRSERCAVRKKNQLADGRLTLNGFASKFGTPTSSRLVICHVSHSNGHVDPCWGIHYWGICMDMCYVETKTLIIIIWLHDLNIYIYSTYAYCVCVSILYIIYIYI